MGTGALLDRDLAVEELEIRLGEPDLGSPGLRSTQSLEQLSQPAVPEETSEPIGVHAQTLRGRAERGDGVVREVLFQDRLLWLSGWANG